MANAQESTNPVTKGATFFRESVEELKKVHHPTRQETWQATMIVLVMLAIFSIFLGLVDYIFGNIMQSILT